MDSSTPDVIDIDKRMIVRRPIGERILELEDFSELTLIGY
jgi:hypothetical protein